MNTKADRWVVAVTMAVLLVLVGVFGALAQAPPYHPLATWKSRAGGATVAEISYDGGLSMVRGLPYIWPQVHTTGLLLNDGSGGLSWSSAEAVSTNFNYNVAADRVMIPASAGTNTTATSSVLIGQAAGGSAGSTAGNSVLIGRQAGQYFDSTYCTMIGVSAGRYAAAAAGPGPGGNYATFIGGNAGMRATNANNGLFIGYNAGADANLAVHGTMLGSSAGQYATNAAYSFLAGQGAGNRAWNAASSQFVGRSAGYYASEAGRSLFIGESSGENATNAAYSVFLGYKAGQSVTRSNTLIIDAVETSRGTNGLVYGEFDNRLLRVNGRLEPESFSQKLLTLSAGAVNMGTNSLQQFTLAAGTNAITLSGVAAGRTVQVLFRGPAEGATLVMPAGVRVVAGSASSTVASNKVGLVTFLAFGTTAADVVARVEVEN